MAIEIERKWVADADPEFVAAGVSMRQGYLAVDGNVTVRLRITESPAGTTAVLTVKGGDGLARTEIEVALSLADAEQLWPHTNGRIDKSRARVPLGDGHVAEVDRYRGELAGLTTVEVEFASREDATAFEALPWFGREVTGDHRWSNASLSRHGRPD